MFVGSLNLDPRSIEINAEMGIVLISSQMVRQMAALVLEDLPNFAYRVELDERDRIVWHGTVDGVALVKTTEPQASGWRRFQAFLLNIVPESQL